MQISFKVKDNQIFKIRFLTDGCASTAVTMSVTNMVCEVILEFGTEEQKRRYITLITSGTYPAGAFGLTEPGGGSDPAGMQTTAVQDGDHFILNGRKIFITSAEYAGVVIVWAVTDEESPKGEGISAFLVEQGTPGYTVGEDESKMGQKGSSTNELIFEDCHIPKENLLGGLHDGFRIPLMELAGGSIRIGSMSVGFWGGRPWSMASPMPRSGASLLNPLLNFRPSSG